LDNMHQLERNALEKPISLRKAKGVVEFFCNDRATYPDPDIHAKKGVSKVFAEEYCPLVRLSQEHWFVRSICLFPEAYAGPDGEIRLWWRPSSKVQITCANEGYSRALMRELLGRGEIAFSGQSRKRNKATGQVISAGRAFTTPSTDVQTRIDRILKAIEAKEKKYYPGTDTLVVQEDPANFRHLNKGGLHKKVCDAVGKGLGSSYGRIYVNYGNELKRVK
jgi:hypothetical protein